MIIECKSCCKSYTVKNDLVYKICDKSIPCSCGEPIAVEDFILDAEELNLFPSGDVLKQHVIKNLKKLYPMPHVILKARKLISDNGSFKDLANLLKTDPALASRVFKVANSAYYGMSGKVSSIQMAATVLGSDTLLQIITLVGNSKMLGASLEGYDLSAGDLWRHALSVAVCSSLIEKEIQSGDGEDSFFAGLIHDSGKIILNSYVLERKRLFRQYSELTRAPLDEAERKILGFDHSDIGCELCLQWNLPAHVAEAIRFHHNPVLSGGNRLSYILQLANHMAQVIATDSSDNYEAPAEALEFLGISEPRLNDLIEVAENDVETLEEDTY